MKNIEQHICEIIQLEIQSRKDVINWHGINLENFLLKPYLIICESSFEEDQLLELYVVLEEFPDRNQGYQIVYDPDLKEFGLSKKRNMKAPLFIGCYGSFLDTLEAM